MFQRFIDDLKASISSALQQVSLIAIAAFALLIAIAFIFTAAFIFVLHNFGAIAACLSGGGLFFFIAMAAGIWYVSRKQQIEARARQRARVVRNNLFADPAVVATGLQVARTIGVKRLIPLLAIGGLALGLLASRNHAREQDRAALAE
jgi:membrane associated rhomboid family serine protease